MTRPICSSVFLILGVLAVGCAQGHGMNEGGQEMSAALADANAENDRHAEACASEPSLSGMTEELTDYEGRMTGLMKRMDSARARMTDGSMMDMQHCSGRAFEHMSEGLDELHADMSGHVDRMRAAPTLEASQSECSAHTDAMREMMGGMMDDLDSMPCMGR